MTVSLVWSSTNGGVAITSLDHGAASNGAETTEQELFLRHDGVAEITDVVFYVMEFAGTYLGGATAAADLAELLAWGDLSTLTGFGGLLFNFLATTSYPSSGWSTYASKDPTGGTVVRTGVGDSEGNGIPLPITTTGAVAAGEVPTGASPNVRFKIKYVVPADEDTVGIRQIRVVTAYNYTS